MIPLPELPTSRQRWLPWAAHVVGGVIREQVADLPFQPVAVRRLDAPVGRTVAVGLNEFADEKPSAELLDGLRTAATEIAGEIRARGWTAFAHLPGVSGVRVQWWRDEDTGFEVRGLEHFDVVVGGRVFRFDVLGGTT